MVNNTRFTEQILSNILFKIRRLRDWAQIMRVYQVQAIYASDLEDYSAVRFVVSEKKTNYYRDTQISAHYQ